MSIELPRLIQIAGFCQLSVLVASALVPFRLNWREELKSLPRLHRQLYFIYGGYVVLGIVSLGLTCICCADDLAVDQPLSRAFALYAAAFWGIRLSLQTVLDTKPFLTTWWLTAGYHLLTLLFLAFTLLFGFLSVRAMI